ncbi:DNA-binding transcriptional ArsR family regulator [Nocardioides daedukensis]|uniref:DNA-binding transcriptional ArsR family regulator n=1 Tax=Nocardioides daedukensis TaxID=634462 RepID=A0A7Y9S1R6_9ACTN|nr:winged helix-turn-helix domain-containing protein [Nocardioides daedukensis]NYG59626.1 DNA-binding transcriptional ArsR family regulator [Nocardioides daedukensis]
MEDAADLERDLADLRERVERLESRTTAPTASPGAPGPDEDTFWALEGVRARRDAHPETADGIVLLTGSLNLPTGEPVEWQMGAATSDLVGTDWSDAAAPLAALGHPVRLKLLRSVLDGVRSTAELAESLGSTGQLHHHLKQLVSTGWLAQRGRGNYEVPPTRVVPLLVILTGVLR